MLADVHISPGVMKPLNVLVGRGGDPARIAAKHAQRARDRPRERALRLAPRPRIQRAAGSLRFA